MSKSSPKRQQIKTWVIQARLIECFLPGKWQMHLTIEFRTVLRETAIGLMQQKLTIPGQYAIFSWLGLKEFKPQECTIGEKPPRKS